MIGECALSGYFTSNRDRYGCCACCPSSGLGSVYGRYNDKIRVTYDTVARISSWIRLLKVTDLKITPDVVYTYLISTGQCGLLNHIMSSCVDDFSSEICCKEFPIEAVYGTIDRRMNHGEQQYYRDWLNPNAVPRNLPPELVKMAEKHAKMRVHNFIRVIQSTIFGMFGNGYDLKLRPSVSLPCHVINALQGFNPVSIDYNAVKSLHATIMPTALLSESVFGGAWNETVNKYPSLKWDPATADPRGGQGRLNKPDCGDRGVDKVTPSLCSHFNKLTKIVLNAHEELCEYLHKSTQTTLDFENVLETFCLGSEIMLYVACLIYNTSAVYAIGIPAIDRANKLIRNSLKSADGSRLTDSKYYDGRIFYGEDSPDVDEVMMFTSLSPLGVLCASDSILYFSHGTYGGGYLRSRDKLKQIFETMYPDPLGEVVSFVINEYKFQKSVADDLNRRLARIKEGGNKNA